MFMLNNKILDGGKSTKIALGISGSLNVIFLSIISFLVGSIFSDKNSYEVVVKQSEVPEVTSGLIDNTDVVSEKATIPADNIQPDNNHNAHNAIENLVQNNQSTASVSQAEQTAAIAPAVAKENPLTQPQNQNTSTISKAQITYEKMLAVWNLPGLSSSERLKQFREIIIDNYSDHITDAELQVPGKNTPRTVFFRKYFSDYTDQNTDSNGIEDLFIALEESVEKPH